MYIYLLYDKIWTRYSNVLSYMVQTQSDIFPCQLLPPLFESVWIVSETKKTGYLAVAMATFLSYIASEDAKRHRSVVWQSRLCHNQATRPKKCTTSKNTFSLWVIKLKLVDYKQQSVTISGVLSPVAGLVYWWCCVVPFQPSRMFVEAALSLQTSSCWSNHSFRLLVHLSSCL